MNVSGTHVAVLVHNDFEESEFEEPISALKDAGVEVAVISTDTEDEFLQALRHDKPGTTFTADLTLAQASPDDYDALLLPGGAMNADRLRVDEAAQQWTTEFLDSGKPVAAICHAPWLLVSAGAVDGRRLTSYYTIHDDITNAGGEWVNLPVVVDGNLITSRQPDDLPQFNDALLTMLSRQQSSTVKGGPNTITAKDEESNDKDALLRSMGYDKERDGIDKADEEEMLIDDDMSDPDEFHPSDQ